MLNKKGFTLLELIVVIIIIGIMATLAVTQYTRIIEKSRSAEAKIIIGSIRSNAAAIYLADGNCTNCSGANIGIGNDYPSVCAGQTSSYFSYGATSTQTAVTITATRCTSGGKNPPASTAGTVQLISTFSTGAEAWTMTGAYL